MAKLNWEKLHQQSKAQSAQEQERFENSYKADFHMFNKAGLWSLKGKHYGKPIKTLPLSYLEWVIDNFDSKLHRQLAEDELRRRYNSNT